MTSIEPIGPSYQRRNIVLSAGNDWIATFTPLDTAGLPLPSFGWPAGTRVVLAFGPLDAPTLTIEGRVENAAVYFRIESEVADTIDAGSEVRARIILPGIESEPVDVPSTELPWWRGKVKRDD